MHLFRLHIVHASDKLVNVHHFMIIKYAFFSLSDIICDRRSIINIFRLMIRHQVVRSSLGIIMSCALWPLPFNFKIIEVLVV
jgi:hypothetical protein